MCFFFSRKLREVFDAYTGQGDQMKVRNLPEAYEKLTQRELKIGELYNYLSASNMNVAANINFDEFCTLMAELTTDNCDMCTNGRFSDPLYWTCALLKTRHLLNYLLIQPVVNVLGSL